MFNIRINAPPQTRGTALSRAPGCSGQFPDGRSGLLGGRGEIVLSLEVQPELWVYAEPVP